MFFVVSLKTLKKNSDAKQSVIVHAHVLIRRARVQLHFHAFQTLSMNGAF
jgi:hypothetical protein